MRTLVIGWIGASLGFALGWALCALMRRDEVMEAWRDGRDAHARRNPWRDA